MYYIIDKVFIKILKRVLSLKIIISMQEDQQIMLILYR